MIGGLSGLSGLSGIFDVGAVVISDGGSPSSPQNEIQRWYFGSQASPKTPVAGSYTFDCGGDNSGSINWNDDAAAVTAALETASTISTGDVSVTANADGFTVEFVNGLAAYDFAELTLAVNSLKQAANTIDVVVTQSGLADVPVTPNNQVTTVAQAPTEATPSNTTTRAAVAPTGQNEIQQLDLGGATTGTFTLRFHFWDNGTDNDTDIGNFIVDTLDATTIHDAIAERLILLGYASGDANAAITVTGSDPFNIEYTGIFANTDQVLCTILNNVTDGNPDIIAAQDRAATIIGVHQQDTCTFSGTPIAGSMTFDGNSLPYNVNANSLTLTGATASGQPNGGSIVTTWDDYTDHSPLIVAANTLISTNGIHQVDACTFGGSPPTAGSMNFDGQTLAYNVDANTLTLSGATASGTPASGIIITTWDDYTTHTPFVTSSGTLLVLGNTEIFTIELTDNPTEGTFDILSNTNALDLAYNISAADLREIIRGWSGWESATVTLIGGVYTINSANNIDNWPVTAQDGDSPLRKALDIEVVTVQDGHP